LADHSAACRGYARPSPTGRDRPRPAAPDPRGPIFNAHRFVEGDLFRVRDPLQVLTGHQSGIENVVAFLTDNVQAQQLEQLAALMDERKCENLEMF
jgi:hypothetical protein